MTPDSIITIYGIGAIVTLILLSITYLIMWLRGESDGKLEDIPLTAASVAGWPIFWILFIASKVARLFKND
jgi:uncharacterized membrane protein